MEKCHGNERGHRLSTNRGEEGLCRVHFEDSHRREPRSKYTAGMERIRINHKMGNIGKCWAERRDTRGTSVEDTCARGDMGGGKHAARFPLPTSSWLNSLMAIAPLSRSLWLPVPGTGSVLLRGLGPAALDYAPLPRRRASSRSRKRGGSCWTRARATTLVAEIRQRQRSGQSLHICLRLDVDAVVSRPVTASTLATSSTLQNS